MLELDVDADIHLETLNSSHAKSIFGMIDRNREYLRRWLAFVDTTRSLEDTENYIRFIASRVNQPNGEKIICIYSGKELAGIIGLKRVDWANRIAEIGYWIDPAFQGRGLVTRSCQKVIKYAFEDEGFNRIEIKCGVGNVKSSRIPLRLGFTFEGIERDGELVNGRYIDLEVYSLLKREWKANAYFPEKSMLHMVPFPAGIFAASGS